MFSMVSYDASCSLFPSIFESIFDPPEKGRANEGVLPDLLALIGRSFTCAAAPVFTNNERRVLRTDWRLVVFDCDIFVEESLDTNVVVVCEIPRDVQSPEYLSNSLYSSLLRILSRIITSNTIQEYVREYITQCTYMYTHACAVHVLTVLWWYIVTGVYIQLGITILLAAYFPQA